MPEPTKPAAATPAPAVPTPAETPSPAATVKMARGTVAKGRTVMAQTGVHRTVNYTADGAPITRRTEVAHKPGQEIELPEHEISRLRAAGFLVDPNASLVKSDIGPTFEREE